MYRGLPRSIGSDGQVPRGPMGVKGAAQSPARRLGTASLWLPPVPGDKVLRGASQRTLILPARRPVWTSGHLPQLLSLGIRNPETHRPSLLLEPEAALRWGLGASKLPQEEGGGCVGDCGTRGDSQVGSMGFCAPETPIHKTVSVCGRAALAGIVSALCRLS